MIKREEITLKNIYAFFQGYLRWFIWITPIFKRYLMRKHIREQITYRMNSINKECYQNGSCIHCGCEIPQLLMANKTCGGNCYPVMACKKHWAFRKEQPYVYNKDELTGIYWRLEKTTKRFIKKENYDLGNKRKKFGRVKSRTNS